ncbi:5-oxoprolinase subunit PxpB [Aquibacillus kalidii]|uniref:5-oxoprolinase subunit PxpB n=1 Tax=Aquibacillus kalidii TaxID=2762597 RepID=UPI001645BC69|nr:5-oxoprolinase subunit PxpB [Aquibacillus kalidii]
MKDVTYFPLHEGAVMIDFGKTINRETNKKILQLAKVLKDQPFHGFIEAVPAYTTLTVYYDPIIGESQSFTKICSWIENYLDNLPLDDTSANTINIPVCYDLAYAPDIEEVARTNNLTVKQVVKYHTEIIYHVYFLGFSPGFPFLGGLNPKLATPRKSNPRIKINAGSVGIAGNQTGIYPSDSPGGWQIIGRTPKSLLQIEKNPPTLLQPGDNLSFYAISKDEFEQWEENQWV